MGWGEGVVEGDRNLAEDSVQLTALYFICSSQPSTSTVALMHLFIQFDENLDQI